jgi:polar amino acid transport system substrate-binding protein
MKLTHRRSAAAVSLAALAIAAAGCGSSSSDSAKTGTGSATDTSSSAAGGIEVPAEIKSKGTLTIAADASYAPNEFMKPGGSTVEGMDPDLAKALGDAMGVKVKVVNATFDAIIPGLASGKYDLGMSSFTDTKEREKTVDFVTYFSAGTAFYTKAQGGVEVGGLADLCGKTVAVEKGTTQGDDATAQGKKCKDAGKPGVNLLTFPDQNGANLALSSGRAQIGMADSPVADYMVKQAGGQFKLTGTPYGTAPYGIAVPKGNGMAKAVLEALKATIEKGTYKQILEKWGIADGAISEPVINGAQS